MKRLLPVLRWVAVLSLGIVLLFATGLFAARTGMFDTLLMDLFKAKVAESGIDLKMDGFNFDPVDFTFSADRVDAKGADGTWTVESGKVAVTVHPISSLYGDTTFSVVAESPRVKGRFPRQTKAPEAGKATSSPLSGLALYKVKITDGSVDLLFPDLDAHLVFNRINVDWLEKHGKGTIGDGSVAWRGEKEQLLEAAFEGDRKVGDTRIEPFYVRTTRLSATGGLRVGLLDRLSGEFNLRADLRDLPKPWLKGLGVAGFDPVGGMIEILGQFGGSLSSPVLGCELEITEGRFDAIAVKSLSGTFDVGEKGAKFRKVNVLSSVGGIRGLEGRIDFGEKVMVEAEMEVEGFDLRRAMEILHMEHFPVNLLASGKIGAKGQLYPVLILDCEGEKIRVKDLVVSTLREGKPRTWYSFEAGTVDLTAKVKKDGIDFGKCFIDAGSVSVRVKSGRIDYSRGLEYDTVVKINNLDTIQRYLPEGFDASGEAEGRFGGPYRALKFDYRLDLGTAKVFNRELGRVRARATYDLETLAVAELSVDGPLARVSARGKAVLLPGGSFDLVASLENGDVAEALGLIASAGKIERPDFLTGGFSASGALTGRIDAPEFVGKVELTDIAVAPIGTFKGVKIDRLNATGSFGLTAWRADELEFRLLGAKVTGAGRADRQKFSVSLRTEELAVERIRELTGTETRATGRFSGVLTAEGEYRKPKFRAEGLLSELRVADIAAGEVDAVASFSDGRLEVRLVRRDKSASVNAAVEATGLFAADLALTNLPWSALPPEQLPKGIKARQVSGKGRVTGLLGGAKGVELHSASWAGTADDVYLADTLIGQTELKAAYPSETPDAARLEAALWNGQARFYTLFSPKGTFFPSIGVDLAGLDLSRLTGSVPALLGGTVDLKATVLLDQMPPKAKDVKGIIREVREFKASGKVSNLLFKGAPPVASATFRAGGEGGRWWLEGDAPPLENIVGKMSTVDFSWEAEATLKDFDPLSYLPAAKDKVKARLGGKVAVAGSEGRLTSVTGGGLISGVEGYGIGPHSGTWKAVSGRSGEGKPDSAEIELLFDAGVSARIVWRMADNSIEAKVEAREATFDAWLPKDRVAKGYTGVFSGRAEATYAPQRETTASAAITSLALSSPQGKARNKGDLLVSYRSGRVIFDSVELLSDEIEGKLTGSLKPFGNYNVKIDALLDLGRIAKKIPKVVDASGKAHFLGTVTGEWDKPKIAGAIEVRKGAEVKVEKLAYPFTELTAQGEITLPGELRIESVDAKFGEGVVHAEGRLTFKDYAPETVDILLSAKHISYEYPKGASYTFDGEFMLAGPFNRLELRGEARLLEFLYTRQIKWRTATLAVLERAKKARIGTRETGDIFVDVAVLGTRNLRLENNLANLDISSDLRIRGYLPTPQIWGRVDVNSGTLRFRAREYRLLRSNIEFLGDSSAVAVVDGRAVTTVGEYTINISATGPVEDIKVDLSSLPPLPRTDIVALLALGTTSEHLEKSEAVTAFEATNILTGSLQDELEGQAYDIFGIDQFQVNPSYSKQAQATVPRITVGKSVAEGIFARYAADLGSGQGQEVSLEYALKPGIVFLGSWNEEGTKESGSFGAEIRFRYTFR